MLRIQNRIKHDNAELLSTIDRCVCMIIFNIIEILKDDRLILR